MDPRVLSSLLFCWFFLSILLAKKVVILENFLPFFISRVSISE